MSRIAKKGIKIPQGTNISVSGNIVSVKGPQGELSRNFSPTISLTIADDMVTFENKSGSLESKAALGTIAAHLKNMVSGVNNKFSKKLILEGIGYKMESQGDKVKFALGFSHPVIIDIPKGITVEIEKSNFTVSGINKDDVGEFAARIRDLKKPEPYKGKGFRYSDEVIKRKQGKKSV